MSHAKPGSVVVGYDGSPHAAAAVQWAAAEARRRGVALHVVYAADYPGLVPGPVGVSPYLPERAVALAADVALEGVRLALEAEDGLEVTHLTEIGSASGVLVDESAGAGLLVVGTRGHGELAGALLGSVAFAVSAHAHCPVVVVRGDPSVLPGPGRQVVVGVDGSKPSQAALRFAATTAAETFAPLVLVTAWHPAPAETWEAAYWTSVDPGAGLGETARRAAEDVVSEAEREARQAYPDLQTRTEVIGGPADRVLADCSADAALVVVGARGRGGFTGLLLGSVSHGVIHRASCPVAVVRA